MSSDIKILRLSTGEDVIAKVGENDQGVSLTKHLLLYLNRWRQENLYN